MKPVNYFFDQETADCPSAIECDYAKLKFCTMGTDVLHTSCSAFRGNISKVLPRTEDFDVTVGDAVGDKLTRQL